MFLAASAEGLARLEGIDLGQAHLDLPVRVRGITGRTARGQRDAVADAHDQAEEHAGEHVLIVRRTPPSGLACVPTAPRPSAS